MSIFEQYSEFSLDELEEMTAELEVEIEQNPNDEQAKSQLRQLQKVIDDRWARYSIL